jgi:hypothetical protein
LYIIVYFFNELPIFLSIPCPSIPFGNPEYEALPVDPDNAIFYITESDAKFIIDQINTKRIIEGL